MALERKGRFVLSPATRAIPPPSAWVVDQTDRIACLRSQGRILDLACGLGRHTRLLLAKGYKVLAVDRDVSGLTDLRGHPNIEICAFDLEDGTPWPFLGERFRAVVVANYLHRPTLAQTIALTAPGGFLIYETFGTGNESYGRPTNPDFLARPHEVADAARTQGLQVLIDVHEKVEDPRLAVVHRAVARKPPLAPA